MGGSVVPRVFLPKMIEWYKQGRFPVDRLVKTFPFAEINEAFAAAHDGEAVKPVVRDVVAHRRSRTSGARRGASSPR